ncbi:MAG: STAS domain-containing protein [Chloroflexota bacterium]
MRQEYLEHNIWLVSISGRLDQSLNLQLDQTLTELLETNHNHIIVDLNQTTYINSGGLRCLVSAWRKARQNEGNVWLCGLNDRLQEIFSMVGFDKVFQIYPTLVAARTAVAAQTEQER